MHCLLIIIPDLGCLLYGLPVVQKLYLLSGLLALKGLIGLLWLRGFLASARHGGPGESQVIALQEWILGPWLGNLRII